jgi:hypothetical protein
MSILDLERRFSVGAIGIDLGADRISIGAIRPELAPIEFPLAPYGRSRRQSNFHWRHTARAGADRISIGAVPSEVGPDRIFIGAR